MKFTRESSAFVLTLSPVPVEDKEVRKTQDILIPAYIPASPWGRELVASTRRVIHGRGQGK